MEQFLHIGNNVDPVRIVTTGKHLITHEQGDIIDYDGSTYIVHKRKFEYKDAYNGPDLMGAHPVRVTYYADLF